MSPELRVFRSELMARTRRVGAVTAREAVSPAIVEVIMAPQPYAGVDADPGGAGTCGCVSGGAGEFIFCFRGERRDDLEVLCSLLMIGREYIVVGNKAITLLLPVLLFVFDKRGNVYVALEKCGEDAVA